MYRQGFAWWSFTDEHTNGPELLREAAAIGLTGVDFLPPALWPYAGRLGLDIVVIDGHESIDEGFCDPSRHTYLHREVSAATRAAAVAGIPFLAVNAGNGCAADPGRDAEVCADGLTAPARLAAELGRCLLLEPLNSVRDHPGNRCDSTAWAMSVVRMVGSPGLRLLFDVYHMAMMGEDVLETLVTEADSIAHVHTAGVPNRGGLDGGAVDYRRVAAVLDRTGFGGVVSHEFLPEHGRATAELRTAVATIDSGRSGG